MLPTTGNTSSSVPMPGNTVIPSRLSAAPHTRPKMETAVIIFPKAEKTGTIRSFSSRSSTSRTTESTSTGAEFLTTSSVRNPAARPPARHPRGMVTSPQSSP